MIGVVAEISRGTVVGAVVGRGFVLGEVRDADAVTAEVDADCGKEVAVEVTVSTTRLAATAVRNVAVPGRRLLCTVSTVDVQWSSHQQQMYPMSGVGAGRSQVLRPPLTPMI